MRSFLIYSSTAHTNPHIHDLKKAGRIDILLHSIVSALYASNDFREDVELHLILMGPPFAPKHIKIRYDDKNTISKKNLKRLIEICLRKAKPNKTIEAHPGVFIDTKTIEDTLYWLKQKNVFMLDSQGTHIKKLSKDKLEDAVFVLGDHEGFDDNIREFLKKKNVEKMSLGDKIYFTSQAITIINYELDNLNI